MGVGEPGLGAPGAAVSWTTFPEELVEGVGFVASPAGVRVTTVPPPDPELLGSGVGVNPGMLEEVEVAGGWSSVRTERMLTASLGEIVVVVVVLTELANMVTVTVTWLGSLLGFPVDDVEYDVDVEDVLNDEVVVVEVSLSEPVMPPLTPAAFIRARTVLSVVQSRD